MHALYAINYVFIKKIKMLLSISFLFLIDKVSIWNKMHSIVNIALPYELWFFQFDSIQKQTC